MLPVDLASQIITHDLQYFRKRVDFLCRMKFCRHHDKEILCCDRIKIWAQIYRNCHADRTRGRHSLHTLRIHTPDINGNIGVDEEYRQYVEMFHAFLAMSKGQHLKGTICSYGSTLVFSFSFDLKDVSVQRGFFRKIAADGIEVELDTNGVTAD